MDHAGTMCLRADHPWLTVPPEPGSGVTLPGCPAQGRKGSAYGQLRRFPRDLQALMADLQGNRLRSFNAAIVFPTVFLFP
jgi:hypothetical protein